MVQSSHSRASSSSSPSTASSRAGDSPSTSDFSGPAASIATKQPQRSSENDLEHLSVDQMPAQHKNGQPQPQPQPCAVDIHSDGRFMSALRAIHTSDQGEAAVPKRRTSITPKTITENGIEDTTTPLSQEKKTPSPVKKPRRKLQRSRAFSIDRPPSPSGRVCEIEDGGEVGEDELCTLFENLNRGS
ncbi:hypothetical protein BKA80DRAFT_307291 [Phyllosticta citrichinensis]